MTAKSTTNPNHTPTTHQQRIAIFAGSFDPFTIGHASIVERGLELFDRIIVAIGINANKNVTTQQIEARCTQIKTLYTDNPKIEVVAWDGLMVDLARQKKAKFFLRGVRTTADFEYERSMADINRHLAGIETILMYTLPEHAAISSSTIRELAKYNVDITDFLPRKND